MAFRVNKYNEIELTRGDTAYLTIPIVNEATGEGYVMAEDDTLTLTVRVTERDANIVFQKVATGSNAFHICPEDTAGCMFAKYKYDVQLNRANGDVYTVIEPSCFRIMAEVTY